MTRDSKRALALGSGVACTLAAALGFGTGASAQESYPDPNAGLAPEVFGKVSALVPMQSAEAVHMGLVWKRSSDSPKILFHGRFPEYTPDDMADPALIDLAIERGAFTTPGLQFNAALRDVLHGFDSPDAPFLLFRPTDCVEGDPRPECAPDDSFQRLTYGGYLMRQGLSQSVPTRIRANRTMERQLLFDIAHPDAFRSGGRLHTTLLDEADFAMNRAAFAENGYSKGMFYNTYCNARVTLSDGRVYVFGGHDMQSNNGLYKVNIFDPETERWVDRREPCSRASWAADPFGAELFARDADAPFFEGCDPREQESTQPSEPSDQRYARWYPTAVPLPNDWVLVLGGHDQDNTVGPDPDRAEKGRENVSQSDADFSASRVNIVVPEVYDPVSDRNIALENARMAFPLYPQAEVVQTGPGRDDWVVCTFNGTQDFGDEPVPGGARFFGPWQPTTWCLDVLGAMKDPGRNVPAKDHWTLLDTADTARPYCCPTASLLEIGREGQTVSHRWFLIGGPGTAAIEGIDFTEPSPRWRVAGMLPYALSTRKAVVLPDGKVLLGHGLNRNLPSVGDPLLDFERREGLRFHLFDPADGSVRGLARTTVSRGLHGTATLLPDASVLFAGENREALVRPNDPSFPLTTSYAGVLPAGDGDQSVPNGQLFFPPYLFTEGGTASRPVLVQAPREVSYRGHLDLTVAGSPEEIASVAIVRSDHNTHSLTAGDRYVKLAFQRKGDPRRGEIRAVAPSLPAQAVPGVYMLFVVDRNGVPSLGRQLRILPETEGRPIEFE